MKSHQLLHTRYANLSLKSKLKLSYFLVAFIPLLSISLCALWLLYQFCTLRALSDYQQNLDQMANTLDYKLVQYNTSMDFLTNNSRLSHALQDTGTTPWQRYMNYTELIDPAISTVLDLNRDFLSITIYQDNPLLERRRPNILTMEDLKMPPDWEHIMDYTPVWTLENGNLVFYSRLINTKLNSPLTIVRAELNAHSIFDLSLEHSSAYDLVLLNEDREILWTNVEDILLLQTGSKKFICLESRLQNMDWCLSLYLPSSYIYVYMHSLLRYILLVVLLCIIIIVPLSVHYSKGIVNRLNHISRKMNEIEDGNLSALIPSPAQDEIGQLAIHFNRMAKSLDSTMKKLYQTEINQKIAENQALRAQINPHFLYNTLSMINWCALRSGNTEISTLITTLSKFYRTSLNHGEAESRLKDELLNVQSYLQLQQKMHADSFTVEYQLKEEVGECIVPTFILQPIVENAIEHGIDALRDHIGKILVQAEKDPHFLYITISNTGAPFSEQAFACAVASSEKGYGLKNVYTRILAAGDSCCMRLIAPAPGYSTSIQIRLEACKDSRHAASE